MIRFSILLFIGMVLLFVACDNKILPEPPPAPTCDPFTYNTHIQPIIDEGCAFSGCHDAIESAPGNFTNYITMKRYLDDGSFFDRVYVDKNMPPSSSEDLSLGQLDSLECWIVDGYPEN